MLADPVKVQSVVDAHAGLNRSELGSFPPPDKATVFAAEIIRHVLEGTAYAGTFAVSVSHIHNADSGNSNFVISFSGYHPNLHPSATTTSASLNADLYEARHPLANRVKVSYTHHLDISYHPMHTTTQQFFTRNLGRYSNITITEIDKAVDDFLNKLNWNVVYNAMTKTITPGAKLQFDQLGTKIIEPVCAAALALRMGIVSPKDEPAAVRKLRGFIRCMKVIRAPFPDADKFAQLVDLLQTLLLSQQVDKTTGEQGISMVLETKTFAQTLLESVRKKVVEAWGANALGRFCAEPKGLYYARHVELIPDSSSASSRSPTPSFTFTQKGSHQGQLAFWYSRNNRENKKFSQNLFIYGQNNADKSPEHGAYMKPCTSCAAQSASMMTGLLSPALIPDWLTAQERELIDFLMQRYRRQLDYTSAQVLAHTIIENRKNLSPIPQNQLSHFLEIARQRAVRMAIIL